MDSLSFCLEIRVFNQVPKSGRYTTIFTYTAPAFGKIKAVHLNSYVFFPIYSVSERRGGCSKLVVAKVFCCPRSTRRRNSRSTFPLKRFARPVDEPKRSSA